MKNFLIGAVLALSAAFAHADEIMIHGISYHGKRTYEENGQEYKYNERNPGISYILDNGVGFGVYKNSYARTTFHVTYRHMFNEYTGVTVGAATGYQNHGSGVIGGLVLRTPSYSGWRVVFLGQPFTTKYRILTLNLSKEL